MNKIKHKRKILYLILIIIFLYIIKYTDIVNFISFENIKEHRYIVKKYVNDNYIISVLIFILSYILGLPGLIVISLIGGFLFNVVGGLIYGGIGAVFGATIVFLLIRYLIYYSVYSKHNNKLESLNNGLNKNGINYLLFLRLVPFFPYLAINILLGISNVRLSTYMVTTFLGTFPYVVISTIAGKNLGSINSIDEVLSGRVIISFLLLAIILIIPPIMKNRKYKLS